MVNECSFTYTRINVYRQTFFKALDSGNVWLGPYFSNRVGSASQVLLHRAFNMYILTPQLLYKLEQFVFSQVLGVK